MTPPKDPEGPAKVVVGNTWSYIDLLGISLGCEVCGEVESVKNKFLHDQARAINYVLAPLLAKAQAADGLRKELAELNDITEQNELAKELAGDVEVLLWGQNRIVQEYWDNLQASLAAYQEAVKGKEKP